MSSKFHIGCLDPRVDLPTIKAAVNDVLTLHAVHLMSDLLLERKVRAISAKQMGIPANLLGVVSADNPEFFLNPTMDFGKKIYLSKGETGPQTDEIRRDIWRFEEVVISGKSLAGAPVTATFEGETALEVQRALEVMEPGQPFSWLTAFHHLWFANQKTPGGGHRFSLASSGLYNAPRDRDPANPNTDNQLRITAPNTVAFTSADGTPLGQINALNPIRPLNPVDQLLLALSYAMSDSSLLLLDAPERLPLALSVTLTIPGSRLQIAGSGWPRRANSQLGLDDRTAYLPFSLGDIPKGASLSGPISAVFLDHGGEGAALPSEKTMTQIARSLSGQMGAVFVSAPQEDAALEALLKQKFAFVYLFTLPGHGVVYAARMSEFFPSFGWLRLHRMLVWMRMPELLDLCRNDALHLRKDGKREPI